MTKKSLGESTPNLKFSQSLAFSLVFLFVFRMLSTTSLLFEQIIISAASATTTIYFLRNRKMREEIRIVVKRILITSLAIMFVMTSIFLNIDRSRSTYVLSWVKIGGIQKQGETWSIQVRSKEAENKHAVIQRISEASKRKMIIINEQSVELTFFGNLALKSFKIMATMFNLQGWIDNQY